MLDATSPHISEYLSCMLIGQSFTCLQLNEQTPFHKQIGNKVSQNRTVLIKKPQCMLLFNLQPSLSNSIGQSVFINFFKMAVTQVDMQCETRLSNLIHQCEYFFLVFIIVSPLDAVAIMHVLIFLYQLASLALFCG